MNSRDKSDQLFERASKVIPGGTYGHLSPASGLPRHFAHFCKSGSGVTFEDVDGVEWLDFMCAYGAVLHGYNQERIENAVGEQRRYGTVFNHPHEVTVRLAEKLTSLIDFASWTVFAKNGSDLTTWAIRVAREYTNRSLVLKVKGAYHGVDAWCDPGIGGRVNSDRADIIEFEWNNLNSLQDLLAGKRDKVAAVIMTPYHHPSFAPSVMPDDDYWINVQKMCNEYGVILVLDDVRAGWRINGNGSHCAFGFEPDLSVYSKALGNGYAISAWVGRQELKNAASHVFLTGSCWNDSIAMRAALESITIAEEEKVTQNVQNKGKYFCKELESLATDFGYNLKMTGPSSMPYPWFEADKNLFLIQRFCKFATMYGLFFHPYHNWFISNAHSESTLNLALAKSRMAFEAMSEQVDEI